MAKYYLYLIHKTDKDAARYTTPAKEGLVTLLKSPTNRYQKIELLRAIASLEPSTDRIYRRSVDTSLYIRYHQYLSEVEELNLAREICRELHDNGDSGEEESRVLGTVRRPSVFEKILLARWRFRQEKVAPEPFSISENVTSYPPYNVEHVASALIEMKQFDQAGRFLKTCSRNAASSVMYALCLTSQGKFRTCADYLSNEWRKLRGTHDPVSAHIYDSSDLPSVQKAYIIAASVHNAVVERKNNRTELNSFIRDIRTNALALTLSAYLCSRDDVVLSRELARLAARCLAGAAESDEHIEMVALLAKATNDINEPLIALPLLRKVRSESGEFIAVSNIEFIRALRLAGLSKEATRCCYKLSNHEVEGQYSDYLYSKLSMELANTFLQSGDRKRATFFVEHALRNSGMPPVSERVEILEQAAAIESQLGNKSGAKKHLSESTKILPPWCRTHWNNWAMLDAADGVLEARRRKLEKDAEKNIDSDETVRVRTRIRTRTRSKARSNSVPANFQSDHLA